MPGEAVMLEEENVVGKLHMDCAGRVNGTRHADDLP